MCHARAQWQTCKTFICVAPPLRRAAVFGPPECTELVRVYSSRLLHSRGACKNCMGRARPRTKSGRSGDERTTRDEQLPPPPTHNTHIPKWVCLRQHTEPSIIIMSMNAPECSLVERIKRISLAKYSTQEYRRIRVTFFFLSCVVCSLHTEFRAHCASVERRNGCCVCVCV